MSESALAPGLVAFRPAVEEDTRFILSSWLRSHRDARLARAWTNTVYYRVWHTVARRLLDRTATGEVVVLVACNAEHPDQIFGWVAVEPRRHLLHYVYVKFPFRRQGIARELLKILRITPEAPASWTHMTITAEGYLARYKGRYFPDAVLLGEIGDMLPDPRTLPAGPDMEGDDDDRAA